MAGEAVSIKGTKNGLVIVFNPERDIEEIKRTLKLKMESSKGFFRGARFTVSGSSSQGDRRYVDELEGICLQYGLVPSPDVTWPPSREIRPDSPPARKKRADIIPIRQQAHTGGEQTLLVSRTIRSGQRIFSRRSIVIMGDVNPGAEVVSEGSIYVLGSCKGNVHAGSSGDLNCEVMALRLQPVSLRIATFFADSAAPAGPASPSAARVSRGKVVYSKW